MREDFQTLIDGVSTLLETPALLEGRDFGLIAFGAHPDDDVEAALDPVRTRSILQRGSSSTVRAWFEGFGITRATAPVRIPPEPAAGVLHGRICLPVREGGVVHGYIWLLDDEVLALDDPRFEAAMETAARIGELLAARSRSEARTGELLRTLLATESEGPSREEAEAELRGALGSVAHAPLALVAVAPWPEAAGGAGGRAAGGPHVVAQTVLDGSLGALVRLRGNEWQPAVEAAERLLRYGAGAADAGGMASATGQGRAGAADLDVGGPAARGGVNTPVLGASSPAHGSSVRARQGSGAGVSAARDGVGGLRAAWQQACAAARAARAEPRFAPVARWDEIGPYRLLARLAPGEPPDERALPLLGHGQRELARTAEVFLDHAGQASRTAAALGIHRQTLYYRLSRVERLTGLDLADGEDRLLLHMALKTARL